MARTNLTGRYVGHGSVLVYAKQDRNGKPLLTVATNAAGSYTFRIRPGTYYLAFRGAPPHGYPTSTALVGPAVVATANRGVRADIVNDFK